MPQPKPRDETDPFVTTQPIRIRSAQRFAVRRKALPRSRSFANRLFRGSAQTPYRLDRLNGAVIAYQRICRIPVICPALA